MLTDPLDKNNLKPDNTRTWQLQSYSMRSFGYYKKCLRFWKFCHFSATWPQGENEISDTLLCIYRAPQNVFQEIICLEMKMSEDLEKLDLMRNTSIFFFTNYLTSMTTREFLKLIYKTTWHPKSDSSAFESAGIIKLKKKNLKTYFWDIIYIWSSIIHQLTKLITCIIGSI